MTEEEFNQKMEKGEVKEVKEEESLEEERDIKDILEAKIEDYEDVLEELRIPKSRARAYRSTAVQSINNNAWTKVELDAESYDNISEFDSTTNYRFTAKREGYYQVNAAVLYTAPVADKVYQTRIYKNGSENATQTLQSSHVAHISPAISDIIYLVKDDYLELYTYHDSGVAKDIFNGEFRTFLAIHKLSK